MRVLFAASELTPIAKVGGLADVMAALPAALKRVGVEAAVVIPRYSFINVSRIKRLASSIAVPLARGVEHVSLYRGTHAKTGVPVFLVENDRYLSSGPGPYFNATAFVGGRKEIQRFTFFSKAVAELLARGAFGSVDVVHCNDWHTGPLASLLTRMNADKTPINADKDAPRKNPRKSALHPRKSATTKVVFTIHNLANQGRWNAAEIDRWMLVKGESSPFAKSGADYNFMAEGIRSADWITTVSESYSREILTPQYGEGLEKLLASRRKRLTGILNGIDYAFFDPAHDPLIPNRFSIKDIGWKPLNKLWLQHHFGFRVASDIPLFGLISRLTEQKGIDLIPPAIKEYVSPVKSRRGGTTWQAAAQFVFLGQGAPEHEQALVALAQKYPSTVFTKIGFDEPLAHAIYAGSDFFLMPSRFEPSGLGQMIAMRYGSVPIVRATGGLADTVFDNSTGFVFLKESAKDLASAIGRALVCYREAPLRFSDIRRQCMEQDFDFVNAAKQYRDLYYARPNAPPRNAGRG